MATQPPPNPASRKPGRRPATLACWLWALAFTLSGLAVYSGVVERIGSPRSTAFRDYNLARLDAFDRAFPKGQALRVVAIGNSRLKYATLDDEEMAAQARANGAGRLGFLRFVNNWAVFQDFELLTDAVLDLRPDVVAIQLELLNIERGLPGQRYLQRDYLAWRLVGYGRWHARGESPESVHYAKPCLGVTPAEHLPRRIGITRAWLIDDAPAASARLARDFVLRAADAGIRVVLLSIPSSQAMELSRPSDQGRFLEAAAAFQDRRENIVALRYGGPMSDDRFCDSVHMNATGRREFSSWLVTDLARRAGREIVD